MALKGKKPLASDPVSPSDSFELVSAPCYKKLTKALKTRGAEVSSSTMSPQMAAVANITRGEAELSMALGYGLECCHTRGFQNKRAPTHAPHTTLSSSLLSARQTLFLLSRPVTERSWSLLRRGASAPCAISCRHEHGASTNLAPMVLHSVARCPCQQKRRPCRT